MIIYYHCTSDNDLLLSFFTNFSSLHSLLFHEMIFILVPSVFCIVSASSEFEFKVPFRDGIHTSKTKTIIRNITVRNQFQISERRARSDFILSRR